MDTRKRNAILAINLTVIAAVFVLNYFYQMMGFDFTLKCICSGGFALLGVVNAVCVLKSSPTCSLSVTCASLSPSALSRDLGGRTQNNAPPIN